MALLWQTLENSKPIAVVDEGRLDGRRSGAGTPHHRALANRRFDGSRFVDNGGLDSKSLVVDNSKLLNGIVELLVRVAFVVPVRCFNHGRGSVAVIRCSNLLRLGCSH